MCGLSRKRFQLGPLILGVESMPIYYQKLDLELKFKLNKIQKKKKIHFNGYFTRCYFSLLQEGKKCALLKASAFTKGAGTFLRH